jgi:hypothetical protein
MSQIGEISEEVKRVKQLGEAIGYGHLMSLASALWRESLREKNLPIIGAFYPSLAKKSDQRDIQHYDSLLKTLLKHNL